MNAKQLAQMSEQEFENYYMQVFLITLWRRLNSDTKNQPEAAG